MRILWQTPKPLDGLLAEFLQIRHQTVSLKPITTHHKWEEAWKGRSSEPVTADRVEAWRGSLANQHVRDIEAICRSDMSLHGYQRSHGRLVPASIRFAFRPHRTIAQITRQQGVRKRQMKSITGEELPN